MLYVAISLLGNVPSNEAGLPPERDTEVPHPSALVMGGPCKQTWPLLSL